MRLKKTDIAYLAGFLDGEGCLSIHNQKNPRFKLHPRLAINNCDYNVLQWIKEKVGFGNIYQKPLTSTSKQRWEFDVNERLKVFKLLSILMPYLKIKRRHAELLIKFISSRVSGFSPGKRQDYTKRELEIYREVCALNKRGKGRRRGT